MIVSIDSGLDAAERTLLTDAVRRAMSDHTGTALATVLDDLGWPDILTAAPELAGPVFFHLLGETGAHAPLLLDVLDHAGAGDGPSAAIVVPFAGGRWVRWDRADSVAPHQDRPSEVTGGRRPPTRSTDPATDHGPPPQPFTTVTDSDGRPQSSSPVTERATPSGEMVGPTIDTDLPVRAVSAGSTLPARALADGRRLLGWWLLGSGHAMLTLARDHAVERVQFGRPLASFQAVRHRLAETLVALDGAEAALLVADEVALEVRSAPPGAVERSAANGTTGSPDTQHRRPSGTDPAATDTDRYALAALLGKAAAGQAALTAARHCQQVLGGIGFTAEHALHRHVRRALLLDGLLGSTRELTRLAGTTIRRSGTAPRIAGL